MKSSGERQEAPAQGNFTQMVMFVLVALVAIIFALFLGYNNAF